MVTDNRLHQGFVTLVARGNGLEHVAKAHAGLLALFAGNGQALQRSFTLGPGPGNHGPDSCPQAHGGTPPLLVIQALGSPPHHRAGVKGHAD